MKVLIATDGTPTAIHAIETAMRLLSLERAGVYLVSVSDPEQRIGGNDDADRDLVKGAELLSRHGIQSIAVARRGPFATEIVAAARELGVDVIVMGSGSRGALSRWLSGSTVDDVLATWTGATLVVRHPE